MKLLIFRGSENFKDLIKIVLACPALYNSPTTFRELHILVQYPMSLTPGLILLSEY